MAALLVSIHIFLLISMAFSGAAMIGSRWGHVATKLIHRDSFLSSRDSITSRARRMIESSKARLAYVQSKFSDVAMFEASIMLTDLPVFYINFSLGEPPVPQLAIMDTGSSLLWVQCSPCTGCSRRGSPMFNPLLSSTYSRISCHGPECDSVADGKCDPYDLCVYNITYQNGPGSRGALASEQITFRTPDGMSVIIPDVIFGCGHDNGRHENEGFTGVFGLGDRMISFVSHLGSGFSYCIGDTWDPSYVYNQLVLGDDAVMQGDSTPLRVVKGFYFINLESIAIGDKVIDMDPHVFTMMGRGNYGVIIDSGSAMSWLPSAVYQELTKEVKSLMNGILRRLPYREPLLCFVGNVNRDLTGFPTVTFQFEGGAELGIEASSMFYQATQHELCMAVSPHKDRAGVSLIGLMAQQYYNVGFDIDHGKLYLQRMDCQLLLDD
ncbi:hypothetical protein MLD38_027366 [Melastoma candidum]|nr:hypothetical protein MLD38_027366 [Melastoma candidum]